MASSQSLRQILTTTDNIDEHLAKYLENFYVISDKQIKNQQLTANLTQSILENV